MRAPALMRAIVAVERLMPWGSAIVAPSIPSRRVRRLMLILAVVELIFAMSWLFGSLAYYGGLRVFMINLLSLVLGAGAIGVAAALLAAR